MHRMICLIVGLGLVAQQAHAADAPVGRSELLAVPTSNGLPAQAIPTDLRLMEADRLEQNGRSMRTSGIIMGIAGAGLVGLSGYLLWSSGQANKQSCSGYSGGIPCLAGIGEAVTGILTMVVGAPLTIGGLIAAGVGHARIHRAERLRREAISISPMITPAPGGAMVGLSLVHF